MSEYIIEKEWQTKAGLKAVVLLSTMGHRCGYVEVPTEHKLYGKHYDEAHIEADVNVHGGLTYSDKSTEYPIKSDGWWFGFDCAHLGDAKDLEACKKHGFKIYNGEWHDSHTDTVKTTEFCVAECEHLASQLA